MTRNERWDQDISKVFFNPTSLFDLLFFIYVNPSYVLHNNGKLKVDMTVVCIIWRSIQRKQDHFCFNFSSGSEAWNLHGTAHTYSIKILWLLFPCSFDKDSSRMVYMQNHASSSCQPPTPTICCSSGFFSFSWPTSLSSLMTHFTYNRPSATAAAAVIRLLQ